MSCLPCMLLAGGRGMGSMGITDTQLSSLEAHITNTFNRVNALPAGPNRDALMGRIKSYNEIGFITAQAITDDALDQLTSDLNDIDRQAVAAAVIPTFVATPLHLAPTGYGGAYMPVRAEVISGVPNRWLLAGVIVVAVVVGMLAGKGK